MIGVRLQERSPTLGRAEAIARLAQLLQMTWPDGVERICETRPGD